MKIGNCEIDKSNGRTRLSIGGTPVSEGLDWGTAVTLANILQSTDPHDFATIAAQLQNYGLRGGIERC